MVPPQISRWSTPPKFRAVSCLLAISLVCYLPPSTLHPIQPNYAYETDQGKFRREWFIFLRVRKYLIPGNFTIFFFLGEPGDDPQQWLLNESGVGTVDTFKSTTDICGNCAGQEEADELLSGGVDITNALYNSLHGTGYTLDDYNEVETWLAKNLKWRILKASPVPRYPHYFVHDH